MRHSRTSASAREETIAEEHATLKRAHLADSVPAIRPETTNAWQHPFCSMKVTSKIHLAKEGGFPVENLHIGQ